jgi:hypothetical protein
MKNIFKLLKSLWAGKPTPNPKITQQRSPETAETLKSCCGNCKHFREARNFKPDAGYCVERGIGYILPVKRSYYCDKFDYCDKQRGYTWGTKTK